MYLEYLIKEVESFAENVFNDPRNKDTKIKMFVYGMLKATSYILRRYKEKNQKPMEDFILYNLEFFVRESEQVEKHNFSIEKLENLLKNSEVDLGE